MDCADFQAMIAGERDDDLSTDEAAAFESHLESCPICGDAVAAAESDLGRLAAILEPPELPASAWASVDLAVSNAVRGVAPVVVAPPRGELVPMPLPVSEAPALRVVTSAPIATAPGVVAPARPIQPGLAKRVARRFAGAGSSGLSIAAAVLVGAFGLAFVSLETTPPPKANGIGRVLPPEDGDVEIVESKPGEKYQQQDAIPGNKNKLVYIIPVGGK